MEGFRRTGSDLYPAGGFSGEVLPEYRSAYTKRATSSDIYESLCVYELLNGYFNVSRKIQGNISIEELTNTSCFIRGSYPTINGCIHIYFSTLFLLLRLINHINPLRLQAPASKGGIYSLALVTLHKDLHDSLRGSGGLGNARTTGALLLELLS